MSWRARVRSAGSTARRLARAAGGHRGTGAVRNQVDERDRPWSAFAGAPRSAPLPPNWDPQRQLIDFVPTVYDQSSSNSCVLQMACGMLGITETRLGLPYAPRSRRAGYRLARKADGITGDVGSRPRTALKIISRHGLPLEADFPWSLRRMEQQVSADLLIAGHEASGLRYEWIDSRGDRRLQEIRQALSLGLPVGFAGPVTGSYFELDRVTGAVPWTSRGETTRGFHARVIVAAPQGAPYVVELNSYGTRWGMPAGRHAGGFARIDEEYLANEAFDLCVLWGWKRAEAQLEQLNAP